MSDPVSPEEVEALVGAPRQEKDHLGRIEALVGAPGQKRDHLGRVDTHGHGKDHYYVQATVYILHSHECRNEHEDLRQCPYSLALDTGIDGWDPDLLDETVVLRINEYGHLASLCRYQPEESRP